MAVNFVQPGDHLTLTAPSTVISGQALQVGDVLFGVVQADADSGAPMVIATCGVWEIEKTSAQAYDVGDLLYWDNSGKKLTSTASTNLAVAIAVQAAAN